MSGMLGITGHLGILLAVGWLAESPGAQAPDDSAGADAKGVIQMGKVRKTDAEYRQSLSEEEYRVAREGATEPAFSGRYWNNRQPGVYRCVACGEPLFDSETKFDSGSGWPSFYQPTDPARIEERPDTSLGMPRTEILCRRCKSHLGHVFEDGPAPTGRRYCVNSASLKFEEKK